MISDEERRRVARRMREIMEETPDIYLDRLCFNALRDSLDEGGRVGETLAKLIDRPTCRNVSGHQDVFTCSECRCEFEIVCEEGNEYGECFYTPFMPCFCPSCGAEVVDE